MRKPFRGPEERVCKICNQTFIAKVPSFRCRPCINKEAKGLRDMEKEAKSMLKDEEQWVYIPDGANAADKFRLERKHLDNDDFRKEWKEYVRNEFDRILSDDKLWRHLTKPNFSESLKMDRRANPKHRSATIPNISKSYPDTRNMSLEDLPSLMDEED